MDFDKLLQVMIAKNGSDLFITEGVPPSLKVNGVILPMTKHHSPPNKPWHWLPAS